MLFFRVSKNKNKKNDNGAGGESPDTPNHKHKTSSPLIQPNVYKASGASVSRGYEPRDLYTTLIGVNGKCTCNSMTVTVSVVMLKSLP